MRQNRDHFARRLRALKSEREPFEGLWKDLRDYFSPRAGRFPDEDRDGSRTDQNVVNETAIFARRTLAHGMASGITPRSRPWLRLLPPDPEMMEYGPVRTWLHDCEKRMLTVFLQSNLYGTLYHVYDRMGVFGLGTFGLYDSFENVTRGARYDIGSYYLTCDAQGRTNGLYREFKLTVEQFVAEFGHAACPTTIRAAWDRGHYDQEFDCVHVVERRLESDPGRMDARNKPWLSVYYHPGESRDQFLRESGFDRFPIICGRWELFGDGPYANSPAMDVLGSVKQLQVMELAQGEGVEKMVNPPLQAPAAAREQGIDTLPGGRTYYDELTGGAGIRSLYDVRLPINELRVDKREVEDRIRHGMFADLFLMLATDDRRQPATAFEIAERKEEKLLALGPVLEGVDNDLLDPLVDNTFARMLEVGMLPPPPPELSGQDIRAEYISVLHQAQKAVATTGIERMAGFAGNLLAAFPESGDKFDADQAIDEYSDALGVPPRMIRTDDQVAEIRAKRAQAEQAAQAAAAMQQAAQGAKTLSETQVRDGNALEMLLGGQGVP